MIEYRIYVLSGDERIAEALEEAVRRAPEQWYSFKRVWPRTAEEQLRLETRAAELLGAEAAQYDMVTANAGLSRFSSQALSGTSPILQTECHYWTHSLLGTGVANRALWRVTDFLNSRVHDQQFFARVAAYADRPMTEGRLESLESDHAIWRSRPLDLVTVGAPEAYLPLVGFFSGRDGFNVTPTTVSAPLAGGRARFR